MNKQAIHCKNGSMKFIPNLKIRCKTYTSFVEYEIYNYISNVIVQILI